MKKRGLVIGKFMPPHKGHLALIEYALQHCETLIVFLCYHNNEPIPGLQRKTWLEVLFANEQRISVFPFEYDKNQLTDSSVSSQSESELWAHEIRKCIPDVDVIFSSEKYGQYVAEALSISHIEFDIKRTQWPVSSSAVRNDPFSYWNYLPSAVQPYFVRKVVILGTESTGKSVLASRLANHYGTVYVPEAARDVIGHTNTCTMADLYSIANKHAKSILDKQKIASRLLFIDTDINITRSYAEFLFGCELNPEQWIIDVNKADLYLFMEADCDFIQDGTRLEKNERQKLDYSHKQQLKKSNINYISISGNWEERFTLACFEINHAFALNKKNNYSGS